MPNELLIFSGFLIFMALMLALDLGIFNKKEEEVSMKQALIMSCVWVSMALIFYLLIRFNGHLLHNITSLEQLQEVITKHHHPIKLLSTDLSQGISIYNNNLSLEFITGYLIEYALSVDNIFVMVLIFSAFSVDTKHYHKVLFWGILGAVFMRFLFIFIGAALVTRFEWILYIFGIFLLYTGVSMFFTSDEDEKVDPEHHPVVRFAARFFPLHKKFEGNNFFVHINGKKLMTPLFLVLMVVEFTDLIFAVDSIPAIFAITKDPYIVFFSNIFAIMGLRSMFFLLVNILHKFHYLKTGLAILLAFIGLKMLLENQLHEIGFTNVHSLLIILFILVVSVGASLMFPKAED